MRISTVPIERCLVGGIVEKYPIEVDVGNRAEWAAAHQFCIDANIPYTFRGQYTLCFMHEEHALLFKTLYG